MAQQGGYRKPANPAAVSGPGRLSKRTDGKVQPIRDVPGGDYGDRQTMRQLQQSAPLAATPSPSAGGGTAAPVDPAANVVPFGAPTARPDEPVTAGAPMGAGVGPEALGLQSGTTAQWQNARDVINAMAANGNASPALQWLAAQINRSY